MRIRFAGIVALIVIMMAMLAGCSSGRNEEVQAYNTIECKLLKHGAETWDMSSGASIACGDIGNGTYIESLRVGLYNPIQEGAIEFQAHIQGIGWTDWLANGQDAGDMNSGKRIEAIKLRLIGEITESYHIYYRVYVTDMGWCGWTCDGETAGTEGLSKGVEAIEIKLVHNDGIAPTQSETFEAIEGITAIPDIDMRAYANEWGWVINYGDTIGSEDSGIKFEGFALAFNNCSYSGSIEYRVYAQSKGWLEWQGDGIYCGTTDEGLRAEGISIRLTDEAAEMLDIYYRVYVKDLGWLGWAASGQPAGSKDLGKVIEALQVVLRAKEDEPPGEVAYASRSGYTVNDTEETEESKEDETEASEKFNVKEVIKLQYEKMDMVNRYYVEDTLDFKTWYFRWHNADSELDIEDFELPKNIDKDEVLYYCNERLYSGLVQVDLDGAEGDKKEYCVQKLLDFYTDKGSKSVYYTEFVGYTMADSPVFRCYYSRS